MSDSHEDYPESILGTPEALEAYHRYGAIIEAQFKSGLLQAHIPAPQNNAERQAANLLMDEAADIPLLTGEDRLVIDGSDNQQPIEDSLPDPPDYLAEDAARRRFEIEHSAWIEEQGSEFQRVMEELEAEHPAELPEPEEDPDMGL